MPRPTRIAMWSGPRFLSTALMRSWESRPDTATADEPFFGYFLAQTGAERPGREDSLARQPHDWEPIVDWLRGPIPDKKTIWYQKHHALHLVGDVPWGWIDHVTNCFLIRDPRLVVASYRQIRPEFDAADLGYAQLVDIFDHVRERGGHPVVLDASDLRRAPRSALTMLCDAAGVEFDPAMLTWRAGRRADDPAPGDLWYRKVQRSTGFVGGPEPIPETPQRYHDIVEYCQEHYVKLLPYRLRIADLEHEDPDVFAR